MGAEAASYGLTSGTPHTTRHITVGGLAVIMGTGIPPLAATLGDKLPGAAMALLSQQVVVGAIVAIVLEVALVQFPGIMGYRDVGVEAPPTA